MTTQQDITSMAKDTAKKIPQIADKAIDKAEDSYDQLGSQGMDFVRESLSDIRASARQAVSLSEETIRKNPFYAIWAQQQSALC